MLLGTWKEEYFERLLLCFVGIIQVLESSDPSLWGHSAPHYKTTTIHGVL